MPRLECVVMDKGYDSDHIRQHLQAREVTPVIPPRQNRKKPMSYDAELYKLREPVERFFNKMK
jgi:IS5 family transposase